MSRMIKLFAALALAALCIGLAACGEAPQKAPETTAAESQEPLTTRPTPEVDIDITPGRDETEPSAGQQEETTPPTTGATEPLPEGMPKLSYQQYMAMTPAEQSAFFEKYFKDDGVGFHNWFQQIKLEYENDIPEVIGTGPVDIGDYIGTTP